MPVRLDKIYTRKGDDGKTNLIGGHRVLKCDLEIECYGTLDELNSQLGVVRSTAIQYKINYPIVLRETELVFSQIQNHLFEIGSCLTLVRNDISGPNKDQANPKGFRDPLTDERKVMFLEEKIDLYLSELQPLNSFVIPGSGILNAQIHVARAVCRRFERLFVRWGKENSKVNIACSFINRLSDFLFAYSRWITLKLGENELLWVRA